LLIGISWPLAGTTAPEILGDTYGVPHIYAADTEELFRAFGWAQAESHGDLILRLYGQAGRAAEYWGAAYLESDRWVHTMDISSRAQAWYEAQTPQFQSDLDAFAAGVNAYAQSHEAAIADEVEAVLPISGVDLLAHGQRVLHFTADRQGHILHLFNGHVPVRPGGDVEDWSGLLPGDTSGTRFMPTQSCPGC